MKPTLKTRLKSKELTIGSWITLGHLSVAEIMSQAGFDWLVVDMEHSAITLDIAQNLIQVIELYGIPPLVRVGVNDANIIKRVMDAGAHGVIVPMVNSKEDAQKAVYSVKYPPRGSRGVGLARAQGYGMRFEKYRDWVNKHSVVIVQIEHMRAVENVEDILTTKGVDGLIVGPYDMSGSMGRPGDFMHPDMQSALKKILEVSRKLNKTAGFHIILPDAQEAITKIKEGYRFIGFSLDTLFLGSLLRAELNKIRGSQ